MVVARSPTIIINESTIKGLFEQVDNEQVASFRGIKYGTSERWTKPIMSPPSSADIDATEFGAICWQIFGDVKGSGGTQSEDCLNLDIYVPAWTTASSSKLPVVIWLYGGSLIAGSTQSYTHLSSLATRMNVVLVAPNYRLAAFGWLALPEISSSSNTNSSGNYGLMDQQLALSWVQQYIEFFNGDKNKVTLLGQSSGGTSIFGHLSSEKSKNLFHAAISLSGSPNITVSLEDAEIRFESALRTTTNCYNISKSNSKSESVMDCLNKLTPSQIANVLPEEFDVSPLLPSDVNGANYPGLIIVDGNIITQDLKSALALPVMDVPLVFQTMEAEMDTYFGNDTIYNMTTSEFGEFLREEFSAGNWENPNMAAETVLSLYQDELLVSTELGYQVFLADYSLFCGNREILLQASSSFTSPVYLVVGTQSPASPFPTIPNKPPCRYPGHNWDYVTATSAFDMFEVRYGADAYIPGDVDFAFGEVMISKWSAVAHMDLELLDMQRLEAGWNFVNLLDHNTSTALSQGFKARCEMLKEGGLGLDQRFWLTN